MIQPQSMGAARLLRQLFFCLVILLIASPCLASLVFINEFHYDNKSSDVNEAIEIAAPLNTLTDNLMLRLYNGNTQAKYDEILLKNMMFMNASNGFGFLTVNVAPIQNGSADGIALFNNNKLLQFISYEGTVTINDDLLDGVTSIDIGVSENSNTTASQSLQLTGIGQRYQDFTWQANLESTFGNINSEQTFIAVNEPKLIILISIAVLMILLLKRRQNRLQYKVP